jgi:hypothetical protein
MMDREVENGSELDEKLKELERRDLVSRWQRHRAECLKLAIKAGATSPGNIIEIAEKLGAYILQGVDNGPVQHE